MARIDGACERWDEESKRETEQLLNFQAWASVCIITPKTISKGSELKGLERGRGEG